MDWIVEIQNKLNNKIKEKRNLQDTDFRWKMAYLVEVAELLDSIGYKWWTDQEPDFRNIKIELVDILHFLISEIQNLHYTKDLPNIKNPFLLIELMTKHYFENDYQNTMRYYWALCNTYSSFDEIITIYLIKNVMNELRQERKTRYFKINGTDIEDNELIFMILPFLHNLNQFNYKEKITNEIKRLVDDYKNI